MKTDSILLLSTGAILDDPNLQFLLEETTSPVDKLATLAKTEVINLYCSQTNIYYYNNYKIMFSITNAKARATYSKKPMFMTSPSSMAIYLPKLGNYTWRNSKSGKCIAQRGRFTSPTLLCHHCSRCSRMLGLSKVRRAAV